MDKVLISGGAGFIGSHMTAALLDAGHQVVVLDDLSTGKRSYLPKNENLMLVVADIRDPMSVRETFGHHPDIEQVIHFAAQSNVSVSLANPSDDAETNIIGTIHLLEEARRHDVKAFVYASSAAVYGLKNELPIAENAEKTPTSPYGVSKLSAEHYVEATGRLYGMSTGCFRFSNVFGPRQSAAPESGVISIFIHKLMNGETPVVYGDGEQTRDFIYVDDLVSGLTAFLNQAKKNTETIHSVYNLGTNTETSINEMISVIDRVLATSSVPSYRRARSGDIPFSRLDNSKMIEELAWEPLTDLEDGIRKTIAYYNKNA
ncbi:NAD-dependent epimerase/dehydratase family protein [Salisediminibacterium halotolerans]|uniref:NAD-dependent epimerase/dehydratase family protein n=1 Tax=Salisediminibacterium halotolerans TaxID=517425 RepID=UPI000EAC51A5|nr:NAD-dependent epimerase/dehydratase family protein [Salisediminibacterium halotolerans]RLJ75592.1 UDP-glucose 4-epimerase [Actinophytocola xinjiangensis]RPE89446.1 UDP-glucose 4-epimerase [Salisediminibacterium halotolerans]TWG36205.1 UDP-glucose 4-epimerase [Salisediminibacterium halotolerans]GEL08190.1 UDP-glucose 4-epimerase [Salisediminibacterium halotolerans]